jgi:hypothetical protein
MIIGQSDGTAATQVRWKGALDSTLGATGKSFGFEKFQVSNTAAFAAAYH